MIKNVINKIKTAIDTFRMIDFVLVCIVLSINIAFCFIKSNPITLSIYEMDSYSFLQKLITMAEGLKEGNIIKHFSYWYYNYGYGYFLLLLILSAPFIALKQLAGVIVISRLLSVIAMMIAIYVTYRLIKKQLNATVLTLLFTTVLFSTYFFMPGLLFYPDWIMVSAILGSIFFQSQSEKINSKQSWLAILCFGCAIGVKAQAIIYAPLLLGMMGIQTWKEANQTLVTYTKMISRAGLKILSVWIGLFILINPFICHPKGWAIMYRFSENMSMGNKSVHIYLALLVIPLFYAAIIALKQTRPSLKQILYLSATLIMYLFMLNEGLLNSKYNMCLMFVLMISIVWLLKSLSLRMQITIAVTLLSITILVNGLQIVSTIEHRISDENTKKLSQLKQITAVVSEDITSSDHILMNSGLPLDFIQLNVPMTHLHFIMGGLFTYRIDPEAFNQQWQTFDVKHNPNIKSFYRKKYIIINKKDKMFLKPQTPAYDVSTENLTQLLNGKWNYELVLETRDIMIFKDSGAK